MTNATCRLSIIVPVGPDDQIDSELWRLLRQAIEHCEVVISTNTEAPLTELHGAHWVNGPAGRARQLNRGVKSSGGNWLWLLHADSRPQPDALDMVFEFIAQAPAALGYGRLKFLDDGPWLTRFNAMGAALRCRFLHLPYGDQSLCLPREWFDRLGGFSETIERGEDLDFVVRAGEAGLPIRPMPLTVRTSARRYREQGWWRTTWQHQVASIRLVRAARRHATEHSP